MPTHNVLKCLVWADFSIRRARTRSLTSSTATSSGESAQTTSFQWKVTAPANTRGTVYIPAAIAEEVTESGKPAKNADGIAFLRMEVEGDLFAQERAGNHTFTSDP